ncbi:hypothetical protein MBLNU13_g05598t1 [Cladosporium sp. NU13]
MSYDYNIAKTVLSDRDKDRLVCLFLNRRSDGNVDWDKATTEFQCASVSSMKTLYYGLLKKIENAGGKTGISASNPTTTSTPKKGRAKKRKATPADEDDDEEATPVVKKKGRKDENEAETQVGSADADDATVKSELANEGEEDTTTWF